MHFLPLISLFFFASSQVPCAHAIRGKTLKPRGVLPSNFLDACQVNCTINRREHTLCVMDCPPLFNGSGPSHSAEFKAGANLSGISSDPRNITQELSAQLSKLPEYPVRQTDNATVSTVTVTSYTIPAYCLPGGPAAPHANVPTTSFTNGLAIVSALSNAIESALVLTTTTVPETTVPKSGFPTGIPVGPGPVIPTGGIVSALAPPPAAGPAPAGINATTRAFTPGRLPTPAGRATTSGGLQGSGSTGAAVQTQPVTGQASATRLGVALVCTGLLGLTVWAVWTFKFA